MAEVVVSPIVDIVDSKLTFLIGAEFGLPYSLKKGLEKLSITFSSIKLVLDDAEKKQTKHRLISVWLKKLRDAAYEAENILDDCALELQRPESQTSYVKQVSDPLATLFDSKQLVFRYKIGKRIKELRQKLDEFAPERHSFHLSYGVGVEEFALDRETSSFLTEPVIYGRVESRESILKILQHSASSQNCISICPILGIRGLGKTTLAQLIYNDEWVVYEFDTRIWISVSNDWSLEKITKMIIEFLSGKSCDLAELSPMQIHLKKLLTSKKFLLVLDDVRDDDREKWRKMTHLLTCGDKGSSVIVTTPLQTVVDSICFQTIVDSTPCNINPTLKLGLLSEHDCWLLFKQYAFGMEIEEITPNLIKIGKEIISKCGGLPLAVKALGSLLHSKSDEFWECARDSEIWNVQEHGGNTILPALRLSYHYLPPILRQCFAFCSLYPKDCEMEKIKLIHQWIANGFIQSNRRVEVETIGDEVFNELRRLSFFQDVNEGKYFKMHDLMHDLASSVMVNDSSITKIDEISNISQMAHHVSVIYESTPSPAISNTLFKSQSVCRTVLFIKSLNHVPSFRLDLCVSSLSKLKYLRVLDLTNLCTIKSLPPTFGRLKHLRYLNLKKMDLASLPKLVCNLRNLQVLVLSGNTKITTLPSSMGNLKQMRFLDLSDTGIILFPESIGGLSNLQTLNLDNCVNLKMLPKDLSSMRSLKNLLIDKDGAKLTGMPLGIGQLTCLKSLSTFVVSPFSDSAGIQELEMLNHLQGELTIKGLQHVRDPRDAQQANLGSKDSLSSVRLLWIGVDKNSSKEVLERLRPHANVQELFIEGYPGVVLPGWVGSSAALPKLTSLELQFMPNVEGWSFGSLILPSSLQRLELHICPKLRLPMPLPSSIEQLTLERWNDPLLNSVEALPNLSSLCVIGFDEVETFSEAPLQNLRSLETLIIWECYTLTRLPTELENLTTLRILKIYFCGGLESLTEGLRNLASLKELAIGHCQSLKSLSESSLQQLTTLETLTFSHCPNLEIISVGFQNLIALRSLTLDCLPQLTSLPKELRHSPRLLLLRTKNCKNLKTLPKWLLNLSTLYFLDIIGCHPELHKRCKDWTGAAHLRVVNEELSL